MFRREVLLGKYLEKHWDWSKDESERLSNEVDRLFKQFKIG